MTALRTYTVTCSDPDISGAAYGCHEIEADGMSIGPNGELILFADDEAVSMFAGGVWSHIAVNPSPEAHGGKILPFEVPISG